MKLDRLFQPAKTGRSRRVVCVGAHPDDAETGCGGTLARLAAAGHEVTIVYLTRREAGIKHNPKEVITWNDCDQKQGLASVRSAEARRACELLGSQFIFSDRAGIWLWLR